LGNTPQTTQEIRSAEDIDTDDILLALEELGITVQIPPSEEIYIPPKEVVVAPPVIVPPTEEVYIPPSEVYIPPYDVIPYERPIYTYPPYVEEEVSLEIPEEGAVPIAEEVPKKSKAGLLVALAVLLFMSAGEGGPETATSAFA